MHAINFDWYFANNYGKRLKFILNSNIRMEFVVVSLLFNFSILTIAFKVIIYMKQ